MSKDLNNKYHHGDLKSALLNAAENLIANKGKDVLSLRRIASEVGVSHMAPYAHFKNKSELFAAVAASSYLQLGKKLQKIQQTENNRKDLVLLYGVAYVEFAIKNPQLYKLMLSQTVPEQSNNSKSKDSNTESLSDSEKTLREASRSTYRLLRDCFAEKESDESIINIQAQGAWALVHGVASLLISGQITLNKNTTIKHFLATSNQGLSA